MLPKLSEASNKMFSSLRRKDFITEKQLKYFTYKYEKATNFDKLYLLPKIHKQLFDVPRRPVISNCGTHTEKCSEFLFFFNWDSLHVRLNSHYEAWSYKKKSTKKILGYRKSV